MLPRLESRTQVSRTMVVVAPALALALTVLTGLALFAAMGYPAFEAMYNFFIAPITTAYGLSELCVKASPLILIGVGLAIGFRANVWNIGAEGQLTLGAIAGGAFAVYLPDSTSALLLPAMMVAGVLGGMLWAAIPALLKTRFNANEILTSLMLTYVATLLLSLLVHGPWRDPEGYNFPQSVMFQQAATVPILVAGTRLHVGVLLALVVAFGGWLLISRGVLGFRIKVSGLAPAAAEYAGFRRAGMVWVTLLISGGLAGLAGLLEVAGPIGQLQPGISPGYGFTAIIVAFLGRLHPAGIVLAGLVLALSYLGGENVQITMGLPQGIAGVFQGMLLFYLLACDVLSRYRVRFGERQVPAGSTTQ